MRNVLFSSSLFAYVRKWITVMCVPWDIWRVLSIVWTTPFPPLRQIPATPMLRGDRGAYGYEMSHLATPSIVRPIQCNAVGNGKSLKNSLKIQSWSNKKSHSPWYTFTPYLSFESLCPISFESSPTVPRPKIDFMVGPVIHNARVYNPHFKRRLSSHHAIIHKSHSSGHSWIVVDHSWLVG